MPESFYIKDCTLSVIATGESAGSLIQMRDILQHIPDSSIYYHFWGERMRPSFVHPEYHNDFARWAHDVLRDNTLSERLGILDPTQCSSSDELRNELIDIIEERIEEIDTMVWSSRESKFHFLRAMIIVFDTGFPVVHPSDLKKAVAQMSASSIFYHFVDARIRPPNRTDDFTAWLEGFNPEYELLIKKIKNIDLYFNTLTQTKQKLVELLNEQFP